MIDRAGPRSLAVPSVDRDGGSAVEFHEPNAPMPLLEEEGPIGKNVHREPAQARTPPDRVNLNEAHLFGRRARPETANEVLAFYP